MRTLTRVAIAASFVALPLMSTSSSASAICIPSWTGYGPVITVKPDLNKPQNSQVGYNSSAFSIQFDLCVI